MKQLLKIFNRLYITFNPLILSSPLFFTSIIFLSQTLSISFGQTASTNLEPNIKATLIYNFTKFVYWNDPSSNSKLKQIKIKVIGADPIVELVEYFAKKNSDELELVVKKVKPNKFNVSDCQLLYIGKSEEQRLPEIIKQVEGTNILTVSDMEGFARRGGMIGFVVENNKMKIEINIDTATKAGLKINAKLLEIAKIVKKED